ncbi:MAG: membrane protein insertase YidC, partial [Balneolaceae bacterium]|nr:membrane protein insertase YidC [Balneolaceae bacterium]
MDRNTVTGLILIFVLMVAWAYFSMPTEEQLQQRRAEQARRDSIAAAQADTQQQDTVREEEMTQQQRKPAGIRQQQEEETPQMGMFSSASISDTTRTVVETDLYTADFTNLGAGPAQITLKNYETWNKSPVQIIRDTTSSAYTLGFLTTENYNVETDKLLFEQVTPENTIAVTGSDTRELRYALNVGEGQRLVMTYTIHGNSYTIDLEIAFEGLEREIIGGRIDFGWQPPLKYTEKDRVQEGTASSAYVYAGGELEQFKLDEAGRDEMTVNGNIDWVATRTRFFSQIIKSVTPTESALLIGQQTGPSGEAGTRHHYESYISADLTNENLARFQMYVGPLAYSSLKTFDAHAYDMVDVGYSFIRWFSDPLVRWVMIPYFQFVDNFMGYGLAIILFAVLIKIVLYPFTKKSFKSMAAMKELQPQIKEIQEKYSDNPQKQQEATLKLYKKAKVNPLGGCLPMLFQFPILITLWRFFQNSILIRQESFLWASDLSAPDYILSLPFSIPFLGEQIAGFVLLMTGAMIVQTQVTGGMGGGMGGGGGGMGAGQMKMLKYIFPLMLLFIFNNFAAGLSLYYLIY